MILMLNPCGINEILNASKMGRNNYSLLFAFEFKKIIINIANLLFFVVNYEVELKIEYF